MRLTFRLSPPAQRTCSPAGRRQAGGVPRRAGCGRRSAPGRRDRAGAGWSAVVERFRSDHYGACGWRANPSAGSCRAHSAATVLMVVVGGTRRPRLQ